MPQYAEEMSSCIEAADRSEREKKARTEARRADRAVGDWREGAVYGY